MFKGPAMSHTLAGLARLNTTHQQLQARFAGLVARLKADAALTTAGVGRIVVTFDEPAGDCIGCPEIVGPAPVQLPDRPLTRAAFDAWEARHAGDGYFLRYCTRACGLAPIQGEDIPDPATDGAAVDVEVWPQQLPDDRKGVVVAVKNVGPVALPRLEVFWDSRNETPQPVEGTAVRMEAMGMGIGLAPEQGFGGTLAPGQQARFLLDEGFARSILSQIAALSPERYSLVVKSMEVVIRRVPGADLGDVIEEAFER